MEYADGEDLNKTIKTQKDVKDNKGNQVFFSEEKILRWFCQVCLGLKHIHEKKNFTSRY